MLLETCLEEFPLFEALPFSEGPLSEAHLHRAPLINSASFNTSPMYVANLSSHIHSHVGVHVVVQVVSGWVELGWSLKAFLSFIGRLPLSWRVLYWSFRCVSSQVKFYVHSPPPTSCLAPRRSYMHKLEMHMHRFQLVYQSHSDTMNKSGSVSKSMYTLNSS